MTTFVFFSSDILLAEIEALKNSELFTEGKDRIVVIDFGNETEITDLAKEEGYHVTSFDEFNIDPFAAYVLVAPGSSVPMAFYTVACLRIYQNTMAQGSLFVASVKDSGRCSIEPWHVPGSKLNLALAR